MESETRAPRIGPLLVKLRNLKFWETESHATVLNAHRHGDAARPRQRRYGSNGAETIFEGAHARRLRSHPLLRLALSPRRKTQSGIRAKFSALQKRFGFAGAHQFRLRLQPRARSVGREGLRLSCRHRAELRGHFLHQLLPEQHPARTTL